MNTHIATRPLVRTRRSARALVVSGLGPLAMVGGFAWAVVQPYRITLLHPRGQGFWWLAVQPPLLVLAAGLVFSLLVAPALLRDLAEAEEA